MREELGNERACSLVRSAVREYAKSLGEAISAQNEGTSLEKLQAVVPAFAAGNTLEIEPIANTDKELSVDHKVSLKQAIATKFLFRFISFVYVA